jgi:hypothetical protein
MRADDVDWVAIGGWSPSARLLFNRAVGDFAVALIDTNDDGRDLCLDCLIRAGGTWQVVSNSVDVSPIGDVGRSPRFVYAWGRSEPEAQVAISYRGQAHTVAVDRNGWWAFLHPTDPTAADGVTPFQVDPA